MADHNAVANKWFAAAALFATALLLAADGPDLLAKTVRFQLQSPGGPPQDDPEDLFSWSASSAAAEQPGDPDLFAWPAAMSEKSAPAPQLLPPAPTAEGLFPALQPQSHELAKTGKLAVRAPHATDVPAAVELSPSHKYSAVNPLRVLIVGDSITAGVGCDRKTSLYVGDPHPQRQGFVQQLHGLLLKTADVDTASVQATHLRNVVVESVGGTGRGALRSEHWEGNPRCKIGKQHRSLWPQLQNVQQKFGAANLVMIMLGTNDVNLFDAEHWVECGVHFRKDLAAFVKTFIDLPARPTVQLAMPPTDADASQCPTGYTPSQDPSGSKAVAACQQLSSSPQASTAFKGPLGQRVCMIACVLPSLIKQVAAHYDLPAPIETTDAIHHDSQAGLIPMTDRFHPSCEGHQTLARLTHERILKWFLYMQ